MSVSLVDMRLAAEPRCVGIARKAAYGAACTMHMSESRARDVELAVSEAVTNAVLAHVRSGSAEALLLQLVDHEGMLEVSVHDTGGGFVPASPEAAPKELDLGGRGLPLMRALADDVHYGHLGGTRLQLFFMVDRPWRDTPSPLVGRR
jgi:anti-sigma regulatory factor (Ser/Thr protein kinase)